MPSRVKEEDWLNQPPLEGEGGERAFKRRGLTSLRMKKVSLFREEPKHCGL